MENQQNRGINSKCTTATDQCYNPQWSFDHIVSEYPGYTPSLISITDIEVPKFLQYRSYCLDYKKISRHINTLILSRSKIYTCNSKMEI